MALTDLICSYYTVAGTPPRSAGPSPRPLAERARACAAAGFVGMGIHFRDYAGMRQAGLTDQAMRDILAEHGIVLREIEFLQDWFADGTAGERARADEEAIYQAAAALDARLFFLSGDLEPGNPTPMEKMQEKFAALAGRAAQRGVVIGVEPCAWSNIGEVAAAVELIQGSGAKNAGLYLDSWHLFRRGYPWGRLRELPASLIAGIQINDAPAEPIGDLPSESRDHRLPPGAGDSDTVGFIAALAAMGVQVPVSVELISEAQRARSLDEAARVAGLSARSVVGAALPRH
jgi:sugar phosphate isomerase/epimerase